MKSEKQPQGQRLGRLKYDNPPCDLTKLPRCNAKAKTTGKRCRQAAMKNGKCYWHGGKSPGPPTGNKNSYKHGYYTAEAIESRIQVRNILREADKLLNSLRNG